MCTAKQRERSISGLLSVSLPRQINTRGGDKLTELKALTVKPCGTPSHMVVTTVTPLANRLRTSLQPCVSTVMGAQCHTMRPLRQPGKNAAMRGGLQNRGN